MKKSILVLFLCCFAVGSVFTQSQISRERYTATSWVMTYNDGYSVNLASTIQNLYITEYSNNTFRIEYVSVRDGRQDQVSVILSNPRSLPRRGAYSYDIKSGFNTIGTAEMWTSDIGGIQYNTYANNGVTVSALLFKR